MRASIAAEIGVAWRAGRVPLRRRMPSINSAILEWPGSSDKPTRRWAVTMAARWTCRVVAARRSAAAVRYALST